MVKIAGLRTRRLSGLLLRVAAFMACLSDIRAFLVSRTCMPTDRWIHVCSCTRGCSRPDHDDDDDAQSTPGLRAWIVPANHSKLVGQTAGGKLSSFRPVCAARRSGSAEGDDRARNQVSDTARWLLCSSLSPVAVIIAAHAIPFVRGNTR